jgi:hypothetical protein
LQKCRKLEALRFPGFGTFLFCFRPRKMKLLFSASLDQGCQIFLREIYQMTIKNIKLPQNIPNGRKVHKPNGHKIYQHLLLQGHPKFTQIGIFGMKIYHLATPVSVVFNCMCVRCVARHCSPFTYISRNVL